MKKVVISRCYGGFGLSEEACKFLGIPYDRWCSDEAYVYRDYSMRSNPDLVACVEQLGDRANGPHARLEIVEIEDKACFRIDEHDGYESLRIAYDVYY